MASCKKKAPPPLGDKFGRLTVMAETVEVGYRMMYCICECGNAVIKPLPNMVRGNTRSCGCLLKDILEARKKS